MRQLARHVILEEYRRGDGADTEARAAFRVCEKLRESLSVLAGRQGFRTLLTRALTRARAEEPWLAKVEVGANGALTFPAEFEREPEPKEAAHGGSALVAQLLELLVTFVGETLTVRLVQDVWPKAARSDPKSGGKA